MMKMKKKIEISLEDFELLQKFLDDPITRSQLDAYEEFEKLQKIFEIEE
jgi:hypothetical protein